MIECPVVLDVELLLRNDERDAPSEQPDPEREPKRKDLEQEFKAALAAVREAMVRLAKSGRR
mgnify:CR=1 FL=1